MKRARAVMVQAAIAAAFLGPGTVATAARAGADFGVVLLWALAFSTVACLVLQEAAARLTIVTGDGLGRALRRSYPGRTGAMVLAVVLGAIILGCAAYEAGNILGGTTGALLATDGNPTLWTMALVGIAGLLLWRSNSGLLLPVLSGLVALMGLAFAVTAFRVGSPLSALASGLLTPRVPDGSILLVLGLIGTTVVPYNLFLGSGLARGHDLRDARLGLLIAVGAGGLISMAVVVTGSAVEGPFSFEALAAVLRTRLGPWASVLFGWGLFAAGLTSAVTAPLAAALTARSLFADSHGDPRWTDRGWRFRAVWLGVLATGALFGLSDVRPVPAIIAAQAFNGILLPMVAVFLLLAVNDRRQLGDDAINRPLTNVLMGAVTAVAVLLGLLGLARAGSATLGAGGLDERWVLGIAAGLVIAAAVPVGRAIVRKRSRAVS